MLPEGWGFIKLEDIADYRRGSFPQPYGLDKWYSENGHPFVQVYDVDKNLKLKPETKSKISDLAADQSVFVPKGTILVTLQGSIGRVAITQYPAYVDRTLLIIQSLKKKGDTSYLAITLQELFAKEREKAPGGIIKTITKAVLNNFKIFWPPLPEQKKIAQILSTWDNAISATERLLENSQQRKKALMQQLLTGKKRLPGFEGEWGSFLLSEVASVIVSPVDKKSYPEEQAVRLCNYTDVYYNARINKSMSFMEATASEAEIKKYVLKIHDVVITKDSETPGDIAVPALINEDLGGVLCGYHLAILRSKSEKLCGPFLSYLLSMKKTRYYFFTLATGATRFGLSVGAINNAELNLPPVMEQKAISEILTTADQEIDALQKRLDHLKLEKKALMQQLLTGKRRVTLN